MARTGPKKTPDHIKVIQGTDQKCRMNPEAPEFERVEDSVSPPDWLVSPDALAEWSRLVPMLTNNGVLTEADRSMLAVVCQTWGEYVDMVRRRVPVTASFLAQMRMTYSEFGLTPASRGNVKAKPKEKDSNPFSRNGRRS